MSSRSLRDASRKEDVLSTAQDDSLSHLSFALHQLTIACAELTITGANLALAIEDLPEGKEKLELI